jgi:hypothetical protein
MAVTVGDDALLTCIQSLGTPKLLASLPGSLDALFRALADQATLELGNLPIPSPCESRSLTSGF